MRHALHAHPELSYNESWTKQHLMAFLRENTNLELHDRGRWFYAVKRSGKEGPGIAFRADFDALPIEDVCEVPYRSEVEGVGHKCGHDGHSANLAALAMELSERTPPRDVYLLFQHAEETGQGAIECVPMLEENDISEIFAFHNSPGFAAGTVATRSGSAHCASQGMSIYFTGRKSHASQPQVGRNPAFPIARLVSRLADIEKAVPHKGLMFATVVEMQVGAKAFGTSPGTGVLRMTIRGEFEAEMMALRAALEKAAAEEAAKDEITCRFTYEDCFPETINAEASVERLLAVCKAQGVPVQILEHPNRGSEDFGHLTHHTPGAIFYVGNGGQAPIHTAEYDFNDEIIPVATGLFLGLIG